MSKYVEIVRSRSNPPKAADSKSHTNLLAFVFAFGLFTMGFDQGHMFSIIQGADTFLISNGEDVIKIRGAQPIASFVRAIESL